MQVARAARSRTLATALACYAVPAPELDLLEWLRACCADYQLDIVAVFHRAGTHPLAAGRP
jgi:hypothetical protein